MTGPAHAAVFLRTGNAAAIAATAALAYYAGAKVGLELRLPPSTPSVLWPPNATLTTLLLFVAPGRWWCVLLGAAVAHFAVELAVWSPQLVTALFLTNCSEALMAAGLIWYISDQPSRFDTLSRISIFILSAGLTAPFLSSFLDAGVVNLFNREDYWTVLRMRLPSNVLAQLAIVPAVAGLLNYRYAAGEWPLRRWLEASAIAAGLILVALAVSLDVGRIGLARAPLAPFIPVLLWAAVRFGPAGVGLSVLATALLAVESSVYSNGLLQGIDPESRINLLQIFLIASTLPLLCVGALVEERQRAVESVRASEALKSSILASIPNLVAVVSRDGRIVTANESWQRFAQRKAEPGAPYLDVWAAMADDGSVHARAVHDGIKSVLDGTSSGFALEYPCKLRGDLWWMMSVVPMNTPGGGAVVTHTDVTARKHAEIDAQRSRDELAHASRVWVMGELTASLSHQLRQPLTGITANAHAALRFLDGGSPNLVEVRQILTDIIADGQRAADVTLAVRDMLRKDVSEHELVNVNDVVRDTVTLLAREAAIRNVSLQLALSPALPLVRGAPVQLRQVLLNLMLNALDAVTARHAADTPGAPGINVVIVTTEPDDDHGIRISVHDRGCGLPAGAEGQIFEPLFTTKKTGMGMGLPIARAIVEAHGGMLLAENHPGGGAVFHVVLPPSFEAQAASAAAHV